MVKIRTFLPIGASAEFQIEKPEGWDKLSAAKKLKAFTEAKDVEARGYLCHQCSHHLETDFEILHESLNPKFTTFEEVKNGKD